MFAPSHFLPLTLVFMSIWNHLLCSARMSFIHTKCRITDAPYSKTKDVFRALVPDNKVKWNVDWSEYSPKNYTDPNTIGKPYADKNIDEGDFRWNAVDGSINRKSHICDYSFDKDGRPLNPMGRTGLSGRGVLGKWGPNHAADPLVTRYQNGRLEFVAIQRGDTGEWAIPGGMVDPGEKVSQTLKREFTEEALNGVADASSLEDLWKHGRELYKGYVDDPRNTDNSWMETVLMNFHDKDNVLQGVKLAAGDDATNLRWIDVDSEFPLYASHDHFISLLKQSRPPT
ncbi:unnamed protein product [Caenorhabditis auriculariae]|uniref:Nudix hydrolase domain-containing protein n=1 Tax=Caenorhabditis auriculariae TaxID=2777116 RepID=A0A8S1H8B3_9PELO|nr:unnamed protein product [Caenorhabditis auriculariae]